MNSDFGQSRTPYGENTRLVLLHSTLINNRTKLVPHKQSKWNYMFTLWE